MTTLADALVITVNAHETQAVLKAFEDATGEKAVPISIENRIYRNLGSVNGTRIFHALSEMGSGGVGAMQQTVDKAIRALAPTAVIAVGIAFGLDEKKQAIGDILISKQLLLYELQRVGSKIVPRGDKPHASARLINFFEGTAQTTWQGPSVRPGVILSGEKLVDNLDYRTELSALESEAVGGEMEGAGVYVASYEHKVDWIVIKAICDWGDGKKSRNKKVRQKKAAKCAADFVVHALQQAPLVPGRPNHGNPHPVPTSLQGLGPHEFEHLVAALALRVLGTGSTGFGPGLGSKRRNHFVGEAPYPSDTDRWSGTWIINSKFQTNNDDSVKWLVKELNKDLALFSSAHSPHQWPNNYIIATNIEPLGPPRTRAYEQCRDIIRARRKKLATRFEIWGGQKILDLLRKHPSVAKQFAHLLKPDNALESFVQQNDAAGESATLLTTHLVVSGLMDHARTKLEQAGDTSDDSAGVHLFFTDIPFKTETANDPAFVLATMARASANMHRPDEQTPSSKDWLAWQHQPERARIWFLKGGPGQGKSTTSQYYCQIQRAALLLGTNKQLGAPRTVDLAKSIRARAQEQGLWPAKPRIPLHVELKEYAAWYDRQNPDASRTVLAFMVSHQIREFDESVTSSSLRRIFEQERWTFVFDGLDEVSGDIKDKISNEIEKFVRQIFITTDSFIICSSRPQGYSGQFDALDASVIELAPLSQAQALACAEPVIRFQRNQKEGDEALMRLRKAISTPAVRELMTTPLQSHIMAVIVRSGQRPPERKWSLYSRFFSVMLAREANRDLHDAAVARLLQQDERLIRVVHSRVGIALHAYAERAAGAQADLPRQEFLKLVEGAVNNAKEDGEAFATIDAVKKASEERLVLISTPVDKTRLRYDIRQLQEFFAAEFLHDGISATALEERLKLFVGDAHWREVVHFLLSALVEGNKRAELGLAVQALAQLDNGDDSCPRSVARRLARGALIASRLLEDGVLEADKSIRNMFRSVIEPLAATSRIRDVTSLLAIEGSASRLWIAELMANHFLETNTDDAVGSAAVAFLLLPPSHPQISAIKVRFENSNGQTLAKILTSQSQIPLGEWQSELIASKLVDDNWTFALGGLLRRYYERRLPNDRSDSLTVAIARKYGLEVADILSLHCAPQNMRSVEYKSFGPLKISRMMSRQDIDLSGMLKRFPKLARTSGFLEVLRCAVVHVEQRNKMTFVDLLGAANHSWPVLSAVPAQLLEATPISHDRTETLQTCATRFGGMSDDEFAVACEAAGPSRYSIDFSENPPMTASDFAQLAQSDPWLALHIWVHELEIRRATHWDPAIDESIVALVCKKPEYTQSYFAAVGTLMQGAAEPRLRGAIAAAAKVATKTSYTFGWPTVVRPYTLFLPTENPTICLIAATMAASMNVFSRDQYIGGRGGDERQAWIFAMRKYVPNVALLRSIIDDLSESSEVRSCAAILTAIHLESPETLLQHEATIIAGSSEHVFIAEATIAAATLLEGESLPSLSAMIVRLMAALPDSERWQAVWDGTITRLRERSGAPVTSAGVLQTWLE